MDMRAEFLRSGSDESDNDENNERIWKFFIIKDKTTRIAECNLCNAMLFYDSSLTNLTKHITSNHDMDQSRLSGDDGDDDYEAESDLEQAKMKNDSEIPATDKRQVKRSAVWNYFTPKDEVNKVASCNICYMLFSYRTTVTNLKRHLHCKHNMETGDSSQNVSVQNVTLQNIEKNEGTDVITDVESAKEEGEDYEKLLGRRYVLRSPIWRYFRCVNQKKKISKCLVCDKLISHSTTTTNLKRHVLKKHPHIKLNTPDDDTQRIILSTGDQMYEIETSKQDDDENDDDQNEPLGLSEVYLEDFVETFNKGKRKKKLSHVRHRQKRKTLVTPVVSDNSSDEEHIMRLKKTVKKDNEGADDSLEYFGKYVISLLKQLPAELSNKLQMNFVKEIMMAQSVYYSQRAFPETNGEPANGEYSITVTRAEQSQRADVAAEQKPSDLSVNGDSNRHEVPIEEKDETSK